MARRHGDSAAEEAKRARPRPAIAAKNPGRGVQALTGGGRGTAVRFVYSQVRVFCCSNASALPWPLLIQVCRPPSCSRHYR